MDVTLIRNQDKKLEDCEIGTVFEYVNQAFVVPDKYYTSPTEANNEAAVKGFEIIVLFSDTIRITVFNLTTDKLGVMRGDLLVTPMGHISDYVFKPK